MSSKDKAKRPIIIKKKKAGHAGAHGGSWKVAYADFVTAMMAFFLLMWLLSVSAPETKKALAEYFQEFSIFDSGGKSILLKGGPPGSESVVTIMNTPPGQGPGSGKHDSDDASGDAGGGSLDALAKRMQLDVATEVSDAKDQVIVEKFESGVRIQITDKEGQPIFPSGSSVLTPMGRKILGVVAKDLNKIDNKIAVEGHTDSKPFVYGHLNNWDLSTDRASAARQELDHDGLAADRLVRVAGYGPSDPLYKDNPADPRNRRISILIFDKPSPGDSNGIVEGLSDTFGEPPAKPAQPKPPADPVEERIQRIYENSQKSY